MRTYRAGLFVAFIALALLAAQCAERASAPKRVEPEARERDIAQDVVMRPEAQTSPVGTPAPMSVAGEALYRMQRPFNTETYDRIHVVPDKQAESADLGFAAAVAEFGMLLRDSEFKGGATFSAALDLARRFKGDDPHGHRAEFIRLIGAAEGIVRLQTAR